MHFRYTLSIISALLFANTVFGQIKIGGQIKGNPDGAPLYGVAVYFPELKIGTVSDDNGYYHLSNLKEGVYFLEFRLGGYKSVVQKIRLHQDTTINIQMLVSVTELNETVVTGATRSTELKRSPTIIKAINRDFLEQNTGSNLIDGLKNIPGISQISTGSSISKPVIRGLSYNRVIVLNNGIRQEGQQWGDEHGIEIDQFGVSRVEIIKGPGSLAYGSDGIAGVMNFMSPTPSAKDTVQTRILSNYQSNNQAIGYSVLNTGSKRDWQWLGQFSNKFSGNYQNKADGKVLNSGSNEINGKLFAGINKKWGNSHLTISSFNTQLGIVEGTRDSMGRFTYEDTEGHETPAGSKELKGYQILLPEQKIHHFSAVSNSQFLLPKGILKTDIGFQNNRRKEFEEATDPDEPGLYLNLNTFTYNLRYDIEPKRGWESTFGINGMTQLNKNKGTEFLIPDYTLFDIGAFAFSQKSFSKITIAGGLRIDTRSVNSRSLFLDDEGNVVALETPIAVEKFSAFQRNFKGLSGSIGISYYPNKISTFKLNFSRGFRAPNIAELGSNGVHEGTFRYELGNNHLGSENSNQIDLGYFLNTEHSTFELTPFVNYIHRYIYLQKFPDNQQSGLVDIYKYTYGQAMLYGTEVFLDLHPHPLDWLHLANSFSLVRGVQLNASDSTRNLPSMPAPVYRGELKAELKKGIKKLNETYVKLAVDHYFRQDYIFNAYGTETETPAYTLLSFAIGTNVTLFNKRDFLNIVFSAENITNTVYQSHLSRLKYAPVNPYNGQRGVYNMGRNFNIRLGVNI